MRRFQPGPQALGFDGSTGRPVGYLHVGTNLELFPTPDAAYSVRLRYVPEMTPLAADGDSIDVPNGWEGFIIHSILLRCDEARGAVAQRPQDSRSTATGADRPGIAEPQHRRAGLPADAVGGQLMAR